MNASLDAAPHERKNPFLDPIVSRWRTAPRQLMGVFHDGDAWNSVDLDAFMKRSLQFSNLLLTHGVPAGEIVLIILEHGVDAHAAFIGAMLVGAVPAFMPSPNVKQDAELYWRQHRDVFAHSKPRAILVYNELHGAVCEAAAGVNAAILCARSVDAMPSDDAGNLPHAGDIALLQHSSGTTGLKKGVKLSYQAITNQLDAYCLALGLPGSSGTRIASWLPLYHDMGLISSFLLPIWLGAPILSIDPFEWTKQPSLLFDAVQDYKATHVWMPNFALLHQVRSMRGDRSWDLSSLAAIICCSEPNKPEAFDAFYSRFSTWGIAPPTLQTCYAMAETVFAVAQSTPGKPVRRLIVDRQSLLTQGLIAAPSADREQTVLLSNGPLLDGCSVRILSDDAGVGERIIGEVCIRAPYLFSGYHNSADATRKALLGDWLRSGDLGFLDHDELFIVGRLKDVIIVNGKNIFAHDVEAVVSRLPDIKPGRAVAFGFYSAAIGSEQLVIVAERLASDADSASIIRLIGRAVSTETGVSCGDVRLVDPGWLIKTTSGKISRAENVRKYAETFCGRPAL